MSDTAYIYMSPEPLERLAVEQIAYLDEMIARYRAHRPYTPRRGLFSRFFRPSSPQPEQGLVPPSISWTRARVIDLRNMAQAALGAGVGGVPVTRNEAAMLKARWKGPAE